MTYIANTFWVVEHLRGNQEVTEKLSTLGEVRDFMGTVVILDIDYDICLRFGREEAVLLNKGKQIGHADLLIAATAQHLGSTLLTRDRDFEPF